MANINKINGIWSNKLRDAEQDILIGEIVSCIGRLNYLFIQALEKNVDVSIVGTGERTIKLNAAFTKCDSFSQPVSHIVETRK